MAAGRTSSFGADLATYSRQLVLDVASLRDHIAALTTLLEHSSATISSG